VQHTGKPAPQPVSFLPMVVLIAGSCSLIPRMDGSGSPAPTYSPPAPTIHSSLTRSAPTPRPPTPTPAPLYLYESFDSADLFSLAWDGPDTECPSLYTYEIDASQFSISRLPGDQRCTYAFVANLPLIHSSDAAAIQADLRLSDRSGPFAWPMIQMRAISSDILWQAECGIRGYSALETRVFCQVLRPEPVVDYTRENAALLDTWYTLGIFRDSSTGVLRFYWNHRHFGSFAPLGSEHPQTFTYQFFISAWAAPASTFAGSIDNVYLTSP